MRPISFLPRGQLSSLITIAILAILPAPSMAASSEAQLIADLEAKLAAVTQRLEALEAASSAPIPTERLDPVVLSQIAANDGWSDKVRVHGDFRYRHDMESPEFSEDRNRQRIRARTNIVAKPTDNIEVGFGLATGGDNPVSANQTLGSSFSTKDINLDLAYAKWTTPVEGLSFTGGKFKNPFHRPGGNGLIWDGDLRPEGLLGSFSGELFFADAVGLWVVEDKDGQDNLLLGLQTGLQHAFDNGTRLTAGVGYFDLGNLQGTSPLPDGKPRGNSVDINGNYLTDFRELEVFGEIALPIGDTKLTLYADYVRNLDADRFDTGWALGARLDVAAWRVQYTYQDLDADAVLAVLTDSDFGAGGTDVKGHVIKGQYSFNNRVSLGTTLFINQRGGNNGVEEDYERLFVDLSFRY